MRLIGYRTEYSDISKIFFFSEVAGRLYPDCTLTHHAVYSELVISSSNWCHSFFIEYNWAQPEATVKTIKTKSGGVLCSIARKSGVSLRTAKILYEITIGSTLVHAHVTHDPNAKEILFTIGRQTIGMIRTPPKCNRYPRYQEEEAYGTIEFVSDLSSFLRCTLLLMTFVL